MTSQDFGSAAIISRRHYRIGNVARNEKYAEA
jgi:hypothetical protein